MKTIIRTTAASLALVLSACGDDTTPGADTLTTGTGTAGDDGVDDGIPTTTAPTTMTTMGMEDSTTAGPTDDTVGPMDSSSSDDGPPPADSSSSDGGPGDSSSSEGGEESSSSSGGGEESSSSGGGMMDCGNGAIDAGEDCDGLALGGANCISIGMGFDGGTLACAGDCTFDTSACTGGKGGSSCEGFCGSSDPVPGSEPACYCDDQCEGFGDCCADICDPGICDGDPAICGGGGGSSCVGFCGSSDPVPGSSPACYCDDQCEGFGDCCPDVCDPGVCDGDPAICGGGGGSSCVGFCGSSDPVPGSSPACYCDDQCAGFGDCCADVCDPGVCDGDPAICGGGGGVPAEWTCNPGFYDALDGCDCSCGAHDPDCDVAGQTLYCEGSLAPAGTTCVDDVCVP